MKKDFAFIVHSRDRSDLPRKYPILKYLPNFIFDQITKRLPPIVVSNITGLVSDSGDDMQGIVVGVPMTAHQLLEDRNLALIRILQAVRLAKSRGAKYIGLGAMTASLTKGGYDVINNIDGVVITTGRAFTVNNIIQYIKRCVSDFNLDPEKVRIGIIGAAGGIGSGVAMILANTGYKNFLLIDLERKLSSIRSKMLKIQENNKDLVVDISHKVSMVQDCQIIIAATSAPEVILESRDVSPGTIIINDAQPSDVSPDIVTNRSDVLVIEGGVLSTKSIDCHFNMGLHHKNDIFSCLAETLFLTYIRSDKHYSMTDIDMESVSNIFNHLELLGFYIKRPQNNSGYISDEYIENFKKYLLNK